jgi:hypothetical protein
MIQTLKDAYKKTFTEPRLSGRYLPADLLKTFSENLDAATTLDEFIDVISLLNTTREELAKESEEQTKTRRRDTSYHILLRIEVWNNLPQFVETKPEEKFSPLEPYKEFTLYQIQDGGVTWSYKGSWQSCVFDTEETAKYFIDIEDGFVDNVFNVISDAQEIAIKTNGGLVSKEIIDQFKRKK